MAENENYLTIQKNGTHEIIIKKSKFITSIARTKSLAEANDFIKQIKQKYHDATHNTYAYVIGSHNEQAKASDNGEPVGTAGVPELKALELMKLKNITVVVTRYFGGIKLGAGGLIRAYSNSVTQAVEAVGVVNRILQQELIFHLAYNQFDKIEHFLKQNNIFTAQINYGVDIEIHVFLDIGKQEEFKTQLINLLSGQIAFTNGEKRYNEILVLSHDYHSK